MLALHGVLLCALALASDPPVNIVAPAERQVFQRAAGGTTEVPITVVAPTASGRLVASARASSGGPDLAVAELVRTRTGAPDSTSGFEAKLALPDGGWYRLAISLDGIAGPVEFARIERFGVGDVFVVAGQSNSTNHGEEKTPSTDDRVSAFDGKRWKLAADPLPGVQDGSNGGSPWPRCGSDLVAAWDVPIAFASCGYGGTSIRQWQPDAKPLAGREQPLFAVLAQRVEALGSVRAILWHQGETDAALGMPTAEYVDAFRALRAALQEETGSNAPWVVAHVSFVPGLEPAKMEAIRAAQQTLWKDELALRGPDTDDLLGEMRHSKDKIHFSRAGLEAHAQRWSQRLIALFPKR